MTMNKLASSILALLVIALLTGCRQTLKESLADKDEQQSLVVSDELSNNQVKCFAEDSLGQMWIGTFRGLNRYDGKEYHQYFCTGDSTALPDNNIASLLTDRKGRLWVGTVNGPARYTDQDNFIQVPMDANNRNIIKLFDDSHGNVYLFNASEVLRYDEASQRFRTIARGLFPRHAFYVDCHIDRHDRLWVVSSAYIRCFSLPKGQLIYSLDLQRAGLPSAPLYSYLSADGGLYLSCIGLMKRFDTNSRRLEAVDGAAYQGQTAAQSHIEAPDYVSQMVGCGAQGLLMNTSRSGLYFFDYHDRSIVAQGDDRFPFALPDLLVTTIYPSRNGNLWIGSYDQGFKVVNMGGGRHDVARELQKAFAGQSVMAVAAQGNNLWVSTLMNGIYRYDCNSRSLAQVDIQNLDIKGKMNAIRHILIDRQHHLWLSTTTSVYKCRYTGDRLAMEGKADMFGIMDLAEDRQGNIWATTSTPYLVEFPQGAMPPVYKQLYTADFVFTPSLLLQRDGTLLVAAFNQKLLTLNTLTGKVGEARVDTTDYRRCIRRSVFIPVDMLQDSRDDIWIGTVTNGVIRYQPGSGHMERISGISCSDIAAFEEDAQGNIWISTMNGLNRWDRRTGRVTTFYKGDGIGGNQFYDRASARLADGTFVFGGPHGLTAFNPIRLTNARPGRLIFQDLRVHNAVVRPFEHEGINTLLSQKPRVTLRHDQNSFSVSFVAINYRENYHPHYYYMLDGYDREWTDAAGDNRASYANLPAGSYTLKVKVSMGDERQASNVEELHIWVKAAPANSWWAWTLYLLAAAVLIHYIRKIRHRVGQEKEATRRAEQEKEQEARVNKMNTSFFANISHEFRTPLTMISGPVELLAKDKTLGHDQRYLVAVAQRSVVRMLRLVNQMLDFNKLENDALQLRVHYVDVIPLIQQICMPFDFSMHEKDITLTLHGVDDELDGWVDADKIDKILSNLLSNALKFTPRGGHVDVSLDVEDNILQLTVADTGPGIPQEKLDQVFQRYYQLDSQTRGITNWGTGIGLYFARRLAELHHGHLAASNRTEGTGAVFTLVLPLNAEAYTAEERVENGAEQQETLFPVDHLAAEKTQEPTEDKRPTVLVVDDDTDVANYLRLLLSPYYHVSVHYDADSALTEVREQEPNVVLSDVAMPGKTGYELCAEIKGDLQLCHIPVILVTAKITAESQIEGLRQGADAYVMKPFEPQVLLAQIDSLLKNRLRVKKILTQQTTADEAAEEVLSPQDQQFMRELYKLMEDELSNAELDVTSITNMLHISRTKLYYKIKGLTDTSPANFFKTYKLNRAAEMIREGSHTLSEIADICGFSTPSHFSYLFKKHFGMSPSEYAKR